MTTVCTLMLFSSRLNITGALARVLLITLRGHYWYIIWTKFIRCSLSSQLFNFLGTMLLGMILSYCDLSTLCYPGCYPGYSIVC